MRLCALLCVVSTSGFHTPQNTARRRTLLRAETETKSPYEVLGVRTSAKRKPTPREMVCAVSPHR